MNVILNLKEKILNMLRIYLMFIIKFLYFLTEKKIAYLFYVFMVVYVFCACNVSNFNWLFFFFSTIIMFCVSNALLFFVLCKIPFLRAFLDKLVGEKFVIKYLGVYTASKILATLAGPIIASGIVDVFTQRSNLNILQSKNDMIFENQKKIVEASGREWSKQDEQNVLNNQSALMSKTKTDGAISQATKNSEVAGVIKSAIHSVKSWWKS